MHCICLKNDCIAKRSKTCNCSLSLLKQTFITNFLVNLPMQNTWQQQAVPHYSTQEMTQWKLAFEKLVVTLCATEQEQISHL